VLYIGASGVAKLFHDAVLKKMSDINERPIIFAL
jgi:malic enzyme